MKRYRYNWATDQWTRSIPPRKEFEGEELEWLVYDEQWEIPLELWKKLTSQRIGIIEE